MKTKTSMAVWSLATLLGFVLLAGCGKKESTEQPAAAPPAAAAVGKPLRGEETLIPVKCNQHPGMRRFVNVSKSPFFAVTGPDGKFEIKGLPPGDYTIAFVQEKLGEQDVKVTLAAKDAKTVDATFKP